METKSIGIKTSTSIAVVLLEAIVNSTGAFPPLKNAAGGALHIAKLVQGFYTYKQEWAELGEHVQNVVACVVKLLPEGQSTPKDTKKAIINLAKVIFSIEEDIKDRVRKPKLRRVLAFLSDPESIKETRRKLDDAIQLFKIDTLGRMSTSLTTVLAGVADLNIQDYLDRIDEKLCIASTLMETSRLAKLQVAEGVSWDPHRVCLKDTQTSILDGIMEWIFKGDEKTIYLLTSVAGAGKTTIAHTIAKLCYEKRLLASSFFFSRDSPERSKHFMSTIVHNLANHNRELLKRLATAFEEDNTLLAAPISRLFELVIHTLDQLTSPQPIVIVIDALDEANSKGLSEGFGEDLLWIFKDSAYKLPKCLRIFITCRDGRHITYLYNQSHVQHRTLSLHNQENTKTMSVLVHNQVLALRERQNLPDSWPGKMVMDKLMTQAEGLPLWLVTVIGYLSEATNPEGKLEEVLQANEASYSSPTDRMDKLYTSVLKGLNWQDTDFKAGYSTLMGTILATQEPLSLATIQTLHRCCFLPLNNVFRTLQPILEDAPDGTIHVIHSTLHSFLTNRAKSSPEAARFAIDEEFHSQRLAFLCLKTLNQSIDPNASYIRYSTDRTRGIPHISNSIPEALKYACNFWMIHLNYINNMNNDLQYELEGFLSQKFSYWMAMICSIGHYKDIGFLQKHKYMTVLNINLAIRPNFKALTQLSIRLTYEDRLEEALIISQNAVELCREQKTEDLVAFNSNLAETLYNLSKRLSCLGYREEALKAITESVKHSRELARDCSAFNLKLAHYLYNLYLSLRDLGHYEDGVKAIEESVKLYRHLKRNLHGSNSVNNNNISENPLDLELLISLGESIEFCQELTKNGPQSFNIYLINYLNRFSLCLSELEYKEEALKTMEECVKLCRELSKSSPQIFNPDLAIFLNNLSNRLIDLGYQENALSAIEESVKLCRQLTKDHPQAFKLHLASSLCNFSLCLFDLGHQETGLNIIEESVELYRQLAKDRPQAFNSHLVRSLNNLSYYLSHLGHLKDALKVIEESIELCRQLVKDQPQAFMSKLAYSLHIFSFCLSDLGHQQDALKAIEESVTLYRWLAKDQPQTFNSDLVESLNILSLHLSGLGHQEDALKIIEEAVKLHRQLAKDKPEAFNSSLANSLEVFSHQLSDVGNQEDALKIKEEFINLYQRLAKDHPQVFNSQLADSLNDFSIYLFNLGYQENALKALEESIELYRHLVKDQPDAFTSDLANSLDIFSRHLSDLDHKKEALKATKECIELYRQLAKNQPQDFNPRLAYSLNILSLCLSDLGYQEDALEANEESVELYRQLAKDQPQTFDPSLSWALNIFSLRLSEMGHQRHALNAIEESVMLCRKLVKVSPQAFDSCLANSLKYLALSLSYLNCHEEAQKAIEESVEIYILLAKDDSFAFNNDLADTLELMEKLQDNISPSR